MSSAWVVALVALLFACAAYLAIQLSAAVCKNVAPFEDGPAPGSPPVIWLIVGAAIVGGASALRGGEIPQLGVIALLSSALVACWYSDVRCGILPDYFTLVPLALIIAVAGVLGIWWVPLSALAAALPFGVAALLSKGRGMGWGDVKLVALGAAVLGFQTALVAFAAACVAAVVVAAIRRRKAEPIAFAPYLVGAIGVALTVPIFP